MGMEPEIGPGGEMRHQSRRGRSFSSLTPFGAWFAFVFVLGGLAAGCSPAPYAPVVDRFAEATGQAEQSLQTLSEDLTEDFDRFLKERMQAQVGTTLVQGDEECTVDSPRCRLVIVSADSDINRQFYPPQPHLGNLVAVMSGISHYADNLSGLMRDESAAAARESIVATFESIQGLATTVAKASSGQADTVPDFGVPVGAAVNWLVGQYANAVKLDGLRTATAAADPVIKRAAGLFAKVSAFATQAQATEFADALSEELRGLDGGITEARLAEAAAAAGAYDTVLRSQPAVVFENLAEAHSALTRSLNSGDVPLAEVIAQLEEFAASADELSMVVEQLREIKAQ